MSEHSLDAPARAKYIKRLGETVVVNEAGVDGKKPHHQDDVATAEKRSPYLRAMKMISLSWFTILQLCIIDDHNRSFPPHYWSVSSSAFFPSAPSTRRRGSSPSRGRGHQTSQQTETGMWWWCRELLMMETWSAYLFWAPFERKQRDAFAAIHKNTVWLLLLTWAYLAIVPHPIGFHNALKTSSKLVGS